MLTQPLVIVFATM